MPNLAVSMQYGHSIDICSDGRFIVPSRRPNCGQPTVHRSMNFRSTLALHPSQQNAPVAPGLSVSERTLSIPERAGVSGLP
jgi:hypothetical protein